MLVESLIAAATFAMSSAPARRDTVEQQDSVRVGATIAPASSHPEERQRQRIDFQARLANCLGEKAIPMSLALLRAGLRFAQDDACADTLPRRRAHAIEYSDWYYRRLQVHRWGSWIELPVFAGEYWLGNKLISHSEVPASWVKPTHTTVAGVLGGLFAVNTVTGVWNLYESRHDTDQRALVWTHSALMLAADAGFAVTGLIAGDAKHSTASADRHRNVALASISVATAGTLLMWLKRGL